MAKIDVGHLIMRALSDTGDLFTLDDETGVEIDTHGPVDGSTTRLEGYYTHPEDGERYYISATLSVEVNDFEFSPKDEEL